MTSSLVMTLTHNSQHMLNISRWTRLLNSYLEILHQFLLFLGFGKLIISSSKKWLLLNDRLKTWQLLQRKNFFIQDYTCVMCDQFFVESRDHLFFHLLNLLEEYLPHLVSLISWDSRSSWQSHTFTEFAVCYGHHHSNCLGHLEY